MPAHRLLNIACASLLAACALLLSGCGEKSSAITAESTDGLRIIAGSELKDVEQDLKADIEKATGVRIGFEYAGTLDAIDRLAAGEAFDGVWVSHGKYLAMNPALKGRIKAQDKIMLSPVVLGVKASKAQQLGWDRKEPTWKEIADAAQAGRFSFGMTSPTASNTGFTATIGLASALAKNPDALTEADVKNPLIAAFFKGQSLTAGSSGWLADAYVRDQGRVDGLINYESVLLSLNASGKLGEPLKLVYPSEGIVTADYPLMLINAAKRPLYDKLVAYLRSKEFQSKMSAATLRRPVNPDATPAPALPQRTLVELPFPGQAAVIDALLENFLSEARLPASSRYVLDLSGSMSGNGIEALKTAMHTLAASDAGSLAARATRFQNRESVGLLTFSSQPYPTRLFTMGPRSGQNTEVLAAINREVDGMQANGGTAIFSSVKQALQELAAEKAAAKDKRYYTVVLMTDGQNTDGISLDEFGRWYRAQDEALRSIRVFPIIFADASPQEMNALAEMTGGKAFESKSKPLAAVFKEIRGYQ